MSRFNTTFSYEFETTVGWMFWKGFAKFELKSEFDTPFSKNMSMIDYFRHIYKSSMKALIVKGKKMFAKST